MPVEDRAAWLGVVAWLDTEEVDDAKVLSVVVTRHEREVQPAQGSMSTPGLRMAPGSTARFAARNWAAKRSGRWRS